MRAIHLKADLFLVICNKWLLGLITLLVCVLFSTLVFVNYISAEKWLANNGIWLMITTLQIKDDTKRAVYCSLIKLLQDNDLAVKVVSSYLIFCCFYLSALHSEHILFLSFFLYIGWLPLRSSVYLCSWQLVGHCAYMSRMRIFRSKVFLIFFQSVGNHVSKWSRKFESLIRRYLM